MLSLAANCLFPCLVAPSISLTSFHTTTPSFTILALFSYFSQFSTTVPLHHLFPFCQNLLMLLLVSQQMWSLHRGLLWPSCLRSWSHLCPLLSILLPWLILFTACITLWNYFIYVFSFLFIIYFHPGKCELYEVTFFFLLWFFQSLQQCLVHNGFLNICLSLTSFGQWIEFRS